MYRSACLVELMDHGGDAFEVEVITGHVHVSDLPEGPGVANLMFTPDGAEELARVLNDAAAVARARGTD